MPVMQWLYFDALECLPEENADAILTEENCSPVSCLITKIISGLQTTNPFHSGFYLTGHVCVLLDNRKTVVTMDR